MIQHKKRVLVVDDEQGILRFVSAGLKDAGYEPIIAKNGDEGLQAFERELPDLVILDINMPEINGLEMCRRIREWSQTPIIMLSARQEERDKVESLRLGADDYVPKPFGIKELLARVEAVLRRSHAGLALPNPPSFYLGDMRINFAERRVTVGDREVDLTPTEYDLLKELTLNHGKVLTHRMLLQRIWGAEYGGETEYIRVFVGRLRKKLGKDSQNLRIIENVHGVGYRVLSPA